MKKKMLKFWEEYKGLIVFYVSMQITMIMVLNNL